MCLLQSERVPASMFWMPWQMIEETVARFFPKNETVEVYVGSFRRIFVSLAMLCGAVKVKVSMVWLKTIKSVKRTLEMLSAGARKELLNCVMTS
jgi:hypothetical protein